MTSAAHQTSSPKRSLALVAKRAERAKKVGDVLMVSLGGGNAVQARIIEDRGEVRSGVRVFRVELLSSESPEGERFEIGLAAESQGLIPSALLKLKSPGIGHGGSASLEIARAAAAANALSWELREFSPDEKRRGETAFRTVEALDRELIRRGLSSEQRDALKRGETVFVD